MSERTIDDEPPASPADALAIIQREQNRTEPDIGPFMVVWGLVWAVIGTVNFGAGQGAWSPTVAFALTLGVLVLGVVFSAVHGTRAFRGVSGPSQTFGALYGWAWFVTLVGAGALVAGLARLGGSSTWVVFVFVVGAIYTLGGAFWRSATDYALGIALQAVAVAAVFIPEPWNSLVFSVLGGGSLVVVGGYRTLAHRRSR